MGFELEIVRSTRECGFPSKTHGSQIVAAIPLHVLAHLRNAAGALGHKATLQRFPFPSSSLCRSTSCGRLMLHLTPARRPPSATSCPTRILCLVRMVGVRIILNLDLFNHKFIRISVCEMKLRQTLFRCIVFNMFSIFHNNWVC